MGHRVFPWALRRPGKSAGSARVTRHRARTGNVPCRVASPASQEGDSRAAQTGCKESTSPFLTPPLKQVKVFRASVSPAPHRPPLLHHRVHKAREASWLQSLQKALGTIISFKGSESDSVPQHLLFPPNTICMETNYPPTHRSTQEITGLQVKRRQGHSPGPGSSSLRLPAGQGCSYGWFSALLP